MFQPGRGQASSPRTLRLPKSPAMPAYGDVQFLSQEALKIIGRLVEMPFPSNDAKVDLILGVRYDHEEGDPNWMLSEVAAGGSKPIWSHPTRDLQHDFNSWRK